MTAPGSSRGTLASVGLLLFAALTLTASPRVPSAASAPLPVTAVDAVGMTVAEMDRALAFYTDVLSFVKVSDQEVAGRPYELLSGVFGARSRIVRLRLGAEQIELTEFLAPKGRPMPADMRANDRAFQHVAIVVSDMAKAYAALRAHGVEHASTGPQRLPDWNANAAGISAFYFRDPDRHFLEIIAFPPGKGLPKWHAARSGLFLGLDHTAIVVDDTDASLRFYRDTLGLEIAGESENHDVEQEHLNNVFGARLRITSLRAATGPGVEFLEYLAPTTGRPYPADEKPNDLIHWQTRFEGAVDRATSELRRFRSTLISTGAVDLSGDDAGYGKAVLARDPDGHAVEIVER
jgi:catechol 2,3-dioxygenase-like lactoylglutathione lyase family enzyme